MDTTDAANVSETQLEDAADVEMIDKRASDGKSPGMDEKSPRLDEKSPGLDEKSPQLDDHSTRGIYIYIIDRYRGIR